MKKKIGCIVGIWIAFAIPVTIIVLSSPLIIGDEIWNFQNVMKMSRGLHIYQDCNVIVTPMFFYIGHVFLKLFGANLLSFRIYNIVIFSSLLTIVYHLLKTFQVNKLRSFLGVCILCFFIMPYISVGANYNVLALTLYMMGIWLFISKRDHRYSYILQGILMYGILFTKQNIGVLYIISMIVCEYKIDKKKACKRLIFEAIIASILCFINLVILYFEGSLHGFINYAFLGMKSFAQNNLTIADRAHIIIFLEILIAIFSYVLYFILRIKRIFQERNVVILLVFAVLFNFTVFPIINLYHTCFAIVLNIIILMILGDRFIPLRFTKIMNILAGGVYTFFYIYGIICIVRSMHNVKITNKTSPYYFSNMSQQLYDDMNDVIAYIQKTRSEGSDILVLSPNAALYMIVLQENHKELDLPFVGNLGYRGEEKLIEQISQLENTEILLSKKAHWQEVQDVRLYIISNLQYKGTKGEYYIYQTKEK